MSLGDSVRRVSRSPRFNIGGAILSAGLEVFSWTQNAPEGYWREAAFILTVFFLGRLALVQFSEAQALREEKVPKFEIVFEPTQGRPYVQDLFFDGEQENPFTQRMRVVKLRDFRFRVGVRNLSSAVVPSVELVLARCTPGGNFVFPEHQLRVMDSNPPTGCRDLQPSARQEPTLFFDVVHQVGLESVEPKTFNFCFANDNLAQPVEPGSYEITLRAQGGGQSHERTFMIHKMFVPILKKAHRLEMEPL